MARILFISEDFIKDNSEIDENVDMKLINPTIWRCQIQYIQNILGTKLYNKIVSDIDGDTLTGNYLTLVNDYCADCLLNYVMFEVQVPLLYKMRDKNVSKKNSDNSQPIDFKEHRYLKDFYQDKAEFFARRIAKYLCENEELFPEYNTEDQIDEVRPQGGEATVSVYLGGGSDSIPNCKSRE